MTGQSSNLELCHKIISQKLVTILLLSWRSEASRLHSHSSWRSHVFDLINVTWCFGGFDRIKDDQWRSLSRSTEPRQTRKVWMFINMLHCFSGIFGVCFSCGSVNNLCEAILLLVARLPSYWVASIPPPHYGPPIKSLERNHGDNSPPYSSPPPPPPRVIMA